MRSPIVNGLAIASMTVLLGLATAVVTAAEERRPPTTSTIDNLGLKAGEPFGKARVRILKAGWKPVRMHQYDQYEYSGTERELSSRGFFEVDSCTTDAGSLCIMYYIKKEECLRLDTKGEQLKYMEVTRWANECPQNS
jgi:hypothetical protein